jgi:hypothetical protein
MVLMSDSVKSKIVKTLLMILVLAFVLSSISGILFITNRYNVIEIDDNKIDINRFVDESNDYKRRIYRDDMTNEEKNAINSKDFLFVVLNRLVEFNVMLEEIKNYKFIEPEDLIIPRIVNDTNFMVDNKFNIDQFNSVLKSNNITENQFIESIQKNESINKFLSSFVENIIDVNENYLESTFIFSNTYKDITLFKVKKNKINIKNIDKITDEEIKRYYNNNIALFILPEQRKIDFIKLDKEYDLEKLKDTVSLSENIDDLAKTLKTKSQSLGYININTLKELKNKYKDIENIFFTDVNELSVIESTDNDGVFIYSVVDVEKERVKTLDESKNDVVNYISEEYRKKQQKNIVAEYLDNYKNTNFNGKVLLDKGFELKKVKIYNDVKNFSSQFIDTVLKIGNGGFTEIFEDGDEFYFGFVNDEGIFNEKSENFITLDNVKTKIEKSFTTSLRESYFEYNNKKYNVKINYKLLDLIN